MLKGISKAKTPIVFKSGVPISVVCVAATFTSITYANNGGKVQLVSSGVHGLTTSPAVGASVYVSWAGGAGVSGLYNVLSVDDTLKFTIDLTHAAGLGTPTVATINTEILLATIPIPPLAANSSITAHNLWSMTASTNIKIHILRFESTAIQYSSIAANQTSARYSGVMWNKGTTQAQASSAVTAYPNSSQSNFELTKNTGVPTALTILCRFAAANEFCRLDHFRVEVYI